LILAMSREALSALPIGAGEARQPRIPYSFAEEFRRSQAYSIDAFLSRRAEYVDIGRHAIAAKLLPRESLPKLVDSDPEDHWYRYLAHAMDTHWDQFNQNQVSFITFNYDRSLEIFLWKMLQHRYGQSEEAAMAMLTNFPIVHVYGSLGSIDPHAKNFVPYGGGVEPDRFLNIAAAGLRIIAEGRDESTEFEQAKTLIGNAEAICFLGFSFDQTNVTRLGGQGISAGCRVDEIGNNRPVAFAATAFGFKKAEIEDAASRISIRRGLTSTIQGMLDMRSLQLLRETQILR